MTDLVVPRLDFSAIGDLPQVYQQARDQSNVRQTLANLGQNPNGQVDYAPLLKSGNLQLAQLGITGLNRQQDLAHQAQRENVADAHQKFMESIALRQANRADETPLDTATQRAAAAQKYGIDPTTPEGKSFVLTGKLPDTTPAANYEPNPDYGKVEGATKLRPISGGPADPAVVAATAEAKQGAGMSDAAVDILARRIAAGDTTALQNVGRGNQGSKNIERIQNRAAELLQQEEGLSPQDAAKRVIGNIQSVKASQVGQSAEARTGATREANLNLILKATDAAIPAALEASDRVARTGWVPLNKIIQGGQVITSNPDLKRFGMANLQLAEHWARAMNPTGVMRESDRDKALSFLSTMDSAPTYKAAVEQLRTQIVRERDAVRGSIPETPQFKSGANASQSQGNGADVMLQHAREAIAQGAPKDAVIQRLQAAGIDPSGL